MLVNRTYHRLGLASIIGASLLFSSSISSSQQAERGPLRYETTVEQVTYSMAVNTSELVVRADGGQCFANPYRNNTKGADHANALLQAKEKGSTVIFTIDPEWSQRNDYREANCLRFSDFEILSAEKK